MEMSSSSENTYVFDPENATEMARLIEQARFATEGMGGPLAGLPELPSGAKVVDLCCGPGGWVLDVACSRPDVEVAGVDISRIMIEYANACAGTQKITNASFRVMNITQPLDFSDHSFDLVNTRFLTGVLKRDAWKPFIDECTRILRPGGILRLTEANEFSHTLNPAFEELTTMVVQAMSRVGYGFSSSGRTWAMSPGLLRLLRQAGYQEIQIIPHVTDYSAHTRGWADYGRNSEMIFLQMKPLFIATGLVTEEAFEQLYKQALIEVYSDDFTCVGESASIWGYAPGK